MISFLSQVKLKVLHERNNDRFLLPKTPLLRLKTQRASVKITDIENGRGCLLPAVLQGRPRCSAALFVSYFFYGTEDMHFGQLMRVNFN